MKKTVVKGYILLFVGSLVTLLMLNHLAKHDRFFQQIHGSYVLLAIGFFMALFGVYYINKRHYLRYDAIDRARILRSGRPYILEWKRNQPYLNYEAILIQALEFIHKDPNKTAQELFEDNYAEVSELISTMPDHLWQDYVKELKMCLRSYL
ncbi:hypothetical protein F3J37_01115 [Pantoea sp. Al-1710]|uniref:Uncharacterized protein n=1 Tax=Candidatus Pantoea communis TaxID=2608354 RepID=A0ABX0RKY7_9GAMM|nr:MULTISPECIES: hypothetical protein [Pantoea]NIG13023.1 hypothetical protein [Pantoea sp. Cy-640]NIG17276.1 hypothetical protein [Pantoea communis]